jgi:hypothetical protein
MPEYEIVYGHQFDGYSKFKAAVESMMADGWVLIGGAQPYQWGDDLEFSQTLVRNFPCVQD